MDKDKGQMNYIKSIHIEGFKKFKSVDVSLNPHMNILVGENEAGKSTILEAIKVVLNQQYRNADKAVLSLSLIHISEPTRLMATSRMPSSA